ncbi:MAG: 3-deoxy-manno-octulosonate cytidylyltransferase [Candidatus Scalindua arabica]|uniref:3-deoxy-manno-octulosonate cytidylyltransferase n=1 Tax=Candidatus Scalindua arabica TaxID=1127984 RepID=A0A941VZT9_9BACT|nr:3-deoxy-manno-octulosonate cytidylyltransferase [Candidatus Scalindua arabica]
MPKTVAIIPARYASTRLPGKLIKNEAKEYTGKYLIEHVYENVMNAKNIHEVIVSTDDERISEVVKQFGGCVKMTSTKHKSGTDRIAEVASNLDADFVVNIQGDEPDVKGSMIDDLVESMYTEKEAVVCTFANEIRSMEEFTDPNAVKVVIDKDNYAMYFSRATIPYIRDKNSNPEFSISEKTSDGYSTGNKTSFPFLKHLGIYMYRKDFLLRFSSLAIPEIEEVEKLEQLRVLSNGYKVKVVVTPHTCEGVDTPEDFERFLRKYRLEDQ